MWNSSETQPLETTTALAQPLVSLRLRNIFFLVNGFPTALIAFSGIVTNSLNMLIFRKMGFHSTTNISFFALSVADFTNELLILFIALIKLDMSGLAYLPVDLTGVLHLLIQLEISITVFGTWLTGMISLERCCCVVLPVRVKKIFTRRTIICLIVCMLILQVVIITVCLVPMKFSTKESPHSDRDQVVLDRTELSFTVFTALVFGASVLTSLLSFGVIIASTIFLGIALRQRERWFQSLPGLQNQTATRKNKNLASIVTLISAIYIPCLLPGFAGAITTIAIPDLSPLNPRAENLNFILTLYISQFLSLSQMTNFFIYFSIMSEFKQCLRVLFRQTPTEIRTSRHPA